MRKFIVALVAFSFVLETTGAFAAAKKRVEPTGAEREKQYAKVVELCRKKYGGRAPLLHAEWRHENGTSGWWCVG